MLFLCFLFVVDWGVCFFDDFCCCYCESVYIGCELFGVYVFEFVVVCFIMKCFFDFVD